MIAYCIKVFLFYNGILLRIQIEKFDLSLLQIDFMLLKVNKPKSLIEVGDPL